MQMKKKLKRCGVFVILAAVLVTLLIGNSYRPHIFVLQTPRYIFSQTDNKTHSATLTLQRVTTETVLKTFPTILNEAKEPKKYHLLINAYMNSGSRFTGSLFGFRKDAFYFYEPLWKASVWDYYKTPNLQCSSVTGVCSNQTSAYINLKLKVAPVPRNKTVTDLLLGVLEQVYRCDFSHFDTLTVKDIADVPTLSGPSWDPYRVCIKLRKPKGECIKKEEEVCKKSNHIVTKVLRMTAGSLEPLLRTFPNLKIIQLFRDPRAIINSRINSKGYPSRDYIRNSHTLCRKMNFDLLEGQELLRKYPNRFKFMFYEDLKSDVMRKTEYLSNFIGMEFESSEVSLLNKVKVNNPTSTRLKIPSSRTLDNAYWWRTILPENYLKSVQNDCSKLLETFGFRLFKSKAELRNLSFPTLKTS